jgi:uncharacterized surface protein with fasciclin (FAS1) repeats
MPTRSVRWMIAAFAAGALVLAACGDDDSSDEGTTATTAATTTTEADDTGTTEMMAEETIVEIAAGNEDFSTLVAAVTAADLGETLSGEGPFTVFAPTNEAFAKVPEATLTALLEPENKDTLTKILTYHVIAAKVLSTDVEPGTVTTVEGSDLTIEVEGDGVVLVDGTGNRVNVTAVDIEGSNGVIHVIDGVLIPAGVTLPA